MYPIVFAKYLMDTGSLDNGDFWVPADFKVMPTVVATSLLPVYSIQRGTWMRPWYPTPSTAPLDGSLTRVDLPPRLWLAATHKVFAHLHQVLAALLVGIQVAHDHRVPDPSQPHEAAPDERPPAQEPQALELATSFDLWRIPPSKYSSSSVRASYSTALGRS